MKYILISVIIVLTLALTSCSLVTQYLPTENETSNNTSILDEFNFTDGITGNVTDDLLDEVDNETNATEDDAENVSDELEDSKPDSLVLTTITATEGDLVSLSSLVAEDPDGDEIEYTYSEPFNRFGLWQTNDGDEGKYLATITASDGVLSTTEQVQIVIDASNKGPVIDCPEFYVATEGEFIDLPCTIYDREGDEVTFAVSGFMDELTYQTGFDDAGEYTVVITATDGKKSTLHEIDLIINEQNRPPVVEELETITATELDVVTVDVAAEDPDGDDMTLSLPILFDENGEWQTQRGDAGEYNLELTVSDGVNDVVVPLNIIISPVNVAPFVESMEPITVAEGETITLDVVASDADGDDLTVSVEGFMDSLTYTTTYDDAGEHEATIIVSDGVHEVSTTVDITVTNVNRPPTFIVK